jgi:hypothetical protein
MAGVRLTVDKPVIMADKVACPSCGGTVRVPPSLVGRSVRCPRCQGVFRAEDPDAPLEAVEAVEERPQRRRRPAPVDQEFQDEPRPTRPRGRAYARQAVQAPAIGLIVSGAIGIAIGLIEGCLTAYAVVSIGRQPGVRLNVPYVIGQVAGGDSADRPFQRGHHMRPQDAAAGKHRQRANRLYPRPTPLRRLLAARTAVRHLGAGDAQQPRCPAGPWAMTDPASIQRAFP